MNRDNELRLTRVEDYTVGRSTESNNMILGLDSLILQPNIILLDNDGHYPTAARQPPDSRQTSARQPPGTDAF